MAKYRIMRDEGLLTETFTMTYKHFPYVKETYRYYPNRLNSNNVLDLTQ